MKKPLKYAIFFLIIAVSFTACDNPSGGSGNSDKDGGTLPGPELPKAGDIQSNTIDGVLLNMVYVPGGLTFPTGVLDDGTATVDNAFWIADTEVTYELWNKVYTWASSGNGATGAGQYSFAHPGVMGAGTGATNKHPVTSVNWFDFMVWFNALTEWYNTQKGTDFECVYTYDDGTGPEIIRDSRDSNATACNGVVVGSTANGFRFLTNKEFELAARYRDGTLWTYGDHASGDDSGASDVNPTGNLGGQSLSVNIGDYCWYMDNNTGSCHVVGTAGNSGGTPRSGNANALGVFDLGGNIREWCFDSIGLKAAYRGGCWNSHGFHLRVGYGVIMSNYSTGNPNNMGSRFARTAY